MADAFEKFRQAVKKRGETIQLVRYQTARTPKKERLLLTLKGDWDGDMPVFEYQIEGEHIWNALGRKLLAKSLWELSGAQAVTFAKKIGLDAIGRPTFYKKDGNTLASFWGSFRNRAEWSGVRRELDPPTPDTAMIEEYAAALDGTGIGFWTQAEAGLGRLFRLMGAEALATNAADDPGVIVDYMEYATAENLRYLEAVLNYPVDMVIVSDEIAGANGLSVSPEMLDQFWFPYVRRIVAFLAERGCTVVFRSMGDIGAALPGLIESGFDAVMPLQPFAMDIGRTIEKFGDALGLIGNVDPGGLLAHGTTEQVATEIGGMLQKYRRNCRRFVLAAAGAISGEVPVRNYVGMLTEIDRFNNTLVENIGPFAV